MSNMKKELKQLKQTYREMKGLITDLYPEEASKDKRKKHAKEKKAIVKYTRMQSYREVIEALGSNLYDSPDLSLSWQNMRRFSLNKIKNLVSQRDQGLASLVDAADLLAIAVDALQEIETNNDDERPAPWRIARRALLQIMTDTKGPEVTE